MDYLGDKLSVAQSHVSQWAVALRRSLQEALSLVPTAAAPGRPPGEGPGRAPLKRASSFRRFASRSRESFRRLSVRSHRRLSSLRKRPASAEQPRLDQLKQCFGRPSTGAKDTDTLVQEAESHYGTWSDHRLSGDSFAPESPSSEGNLTPARRPLAGSRPSSFSSQTEPTSTPEPQDSSREPRSASPEGSSTDADSSAEGPRVPAPVAGASLDFSFLEQTAVLDSSALKARVQLSKRRHQARAPISRALRRGSPQEAGQPPQPPQHLGPGGAETAWMIQDSAGEASAPREACEEGEAPPPSERPPFPQGPPRLPVFPRVDHSALKAQLRKRHEPEGTGGAPSAQPPRSPKSPFHAGLSGGRALPPGTEKEERVTPPPSPQWLKELRSKKRHSQYENQV